MLKVLMAVGEAGLGAMQTKAETIVTLTSESDQLIDQTNFPVKGSGSNKSRTWGWGVGKMLCCKHEGMSPVPAPRIKSLLVCHLVIPALEG